MNKQNSHPPTIITINKTLKYLLFLSLIVFAITIFIQKIRNFDIWWHLKAGEYILTTHVIPKLDIFSYTATAHRWINNQWLADVLFFSIFKHFGLNSLIVLKALILAGTFGILFTMVYRRKMYIFSVALILLAILASSHRFLIRPFIFNFFFITIYLYILERYRHKKTKMIFLLPIFQMIWTNLHGGSLVGLIIIFSYIIGEALSWKIKLPFKWNESSLIKDKKYYILLGLAIASLLSGLINPEGLAGLSFPFLTLTGFNETQYKEIVMKYVAELRPSFISYNFFKLYPYYKLLLIISISTFILNFKRLRLAHLFIYSIFLIFSVKANRNIPFFVLGALPFTMFNIETAIQGARTHKILQYLYAKRYVLNAVFQILLIAGMTILISKNMAPQYLFRDKIIRSFGFGIMDLKYPKDAVDFIQKTDIKGNIFNTFESGGYFIWRNFPRKHVFIDGRTEVYGPEFYKNYIQLFSHPERFKQISEKYNINYVLLTRIYTATTPFLTYLYKHPEWTLVHFDEISTVFVKNSQQNAKIIEKSKDLASGNELSQDPIKGIFPFTLFKKAEFFRATGQHDQAIAEFKKALKAASDTALIHNNIGLTYYDQGKHIKAIYEFQKSLEKNPRYAEAYNNLGSVYAHQEKRKEAILEFKKALSIDPSYLMARKNLAMAYSKTNQQQQAIREYKKVLKIAPDNLEVHQNLGLMLYNQGEIIESMKIFKQLLKLDGNSALAHNNLGVIHNALGNTDMAIKEWNLTLKLDPQHKQARYNLEKILQSN
ncbi:MAG: tetratricopeptide repeat protein [PVC group bacterium]|nr:tetratricopeptide repeat protein [PVC group bacterium]